MSFVLGVGQRGALVGYNGTGKTTILKIVAGELAADAGSVELNPGATVGYLPQDTSVVGDEPITEYLRRATGLAALEEEMALLGECLEELEAQKRYGTVLSNYERMHGYEFERRVQAMLSGFGLEDVESARAVSSLSGGQKTKVALVALLLREDDVLLLDEPTNNLDLPALIWLENFIRASRATVLMVSHDRQFVDRVANKVIELDWHTRTARMTNGTYSDYLVVRKKEQARQAADYEAQQEEIERLEERAEAMKRRARQGAQFIGTDNDKFLRGFKRDQAGKSGRGAKVLEQRIEQMDKVEKPFEREPLSIPVTRKLGEGNRDVALKDVVVGYPGGFTIGPVSLAMPFGRRLCLLGANGTGKSTLLKTITGHVTPRAGTVQIGSGVRLGDMMQEHESLS
ncbi:MAG: ATP-binding cassette domain-containing protein, partial [Actinomycetota bacterium]